MMVTETDNPSDDLSVVVLVQNLKKLVWNLRIFYQGFSYEFLLSIGGKRIRLQELVATKYSMRYIIKEADIECLSNMKTVAIEI